MDGLLMMLGIGPAIIVLDWCLRTFKGYRKGKSNASRNFCEDMRVETAERGIKSLKEYHRHISRNNWSGASAPMKVVLECYKECQGSYELTFGPKDKVKTVHLDRINDLSEVFFALVNYFDDVIDGCDTCITPYDVRKSNNKTTETEKGGTQKDDDSDPMPS